MSRQRMQLFRNDQIRWQNVLASDEVDSSFELFWNDFKAFYNIHFTLKQVRFNKNMHSINKFMTRGLLISRLTKNNLLKANVLQRTPESAMAYKNYRNIYNKVLRASKKLYFKDNLVKNRKN